MPPQKPEPITRAVARAVTILHSFSEDRPELGVTELSQLTGIDKSTVYRLLNTLQQGRLVEKNPSSGKYRLGLGLLRLAGLVQRHLDLPRVARPYLQHLAELSQETVNLSVMTDDDQVINIDGIPSPHMVRNVGWKGRVMAAHAVSGGKAMLAFLPEEHTERLIRRGLPRFTPRTITDADRFRQELDQVRQQGYAIAEEELETGLSAVAAPIYNQDGEVVAIISVSGPSFRLPTERLHELGRATKEAADAVSAQLGYLG